MATSKQRLVVVIGAVALVGICYAVSPPIAQDPRYHVFADRRTLFGVPNFWNVVSNLPFFLVAMYGVKTLRRAVFVASWERVAYVVLLAATVAVGIGSSYYHLRPDDPHLFWDRLPLTIVLTSLLALVIGDRAGSGAGQVALAPLVLFGAASVCYWRASGDLRLYAIVQFGAAVAVPLLLALLPPHYTGAPWMWGTVLLYGVAKLAELIDGHPWKHIAAAAALQCFIMWMDRRRPVPDRFLTAAAIPEGALQ